MAKISAKEFASYWGDIDSPTHCVYFHLTKEEIDEWIKHGKFSKIKEYCRQLPYDVKFTCMKPTYPGAAKKFGFVFEIDEDGNRLVHLVEELQKLRSCVKVEKIAFEEISDSEPDGSGRLGATIQEYCPLVI